MPWQPRPIAYPDAELVMSQQTRAAFSDPAIFIGNKVPATRRPKMIIWNRDGGAADGLFDRPTMRCRVWGSTDQEATDLARDVAAFVTGMADGAPVTGAVHESGPYDVPDASGQPQKYLLFTITMRGVSA